MWKDLLILMSMVLCGAITLLLTGVVMLNLGLRFHGNYEHYGFLYPALPWGPAILGFLAPAVLAWYLGRRD